MQFEIPIKRCGGSGFPGDVTSASRNLHSLPCRGRFQPSWENGGDRRRRTGLGRRGGYPKSKYFCLCAQTSASPSPERARASRDAGPPQLRGSVAPGAQAARPPARLRCCSDSPGPSPAPAAAPGPGSCHQPVASPFPPASATAGSCGMQPQPRERCPSLPSGSLTPLSGWGSGHGRGKSALCLVCASVSLCHKANIIAPSSPSEALPGKIHLIYRRCPGRIDKGHRKAAKCQRNSSFLSLPVIGERGRET